MAADGIASLVKILVHMSFIKRKNTFLSNSDNYQSYYGNHDIKLLSLSLNF